MIKLIASDLDDTLLNGKFQISKKDKNTIKKLKEKGIYFTIATGRVTKSVEKFAKELDVEIPYIAFNGAKIVDPKTHKVIFSREIEKSRIAKILEYSERKGIHCNIYTDEKVLVKEETHWSEFYKTFAQEFPIEAVGSLQDYPFDLTPKVIMIGDHNRLKEAYDDIIKFRHKDINIFFSKANFLEFTDIKATKGDALKYIADKLKIKREETAAIGDSFNDQSMIEFAGISAVVKNGREELKKIADYVSYSNENSGFSDFVKKYVLK